MKNLLYLFFKKKPNQKSLKSVFSEKNLLLINQHKTGNTTRIEVVEPIIKRNTLN